MYGGTIQRWWNVKSNGCEIERETRVCLGGELYDRQELCLITKLKGEGRYLVWWCPACDEMPLRALRSLASPACAGPAL